MSTQHVCVVGAGLCGTLLAIRLAQHGHKVSLFERRPDMRTAKLAAGRSINLALSDRGWKALRLAGLTEKVRELVIPMRGRMIHGMDGETRLSPYSGREHEYINSVSRPGLNICMLNMATALPNLQIFFEHACTKVDPINGNLNCTTPDGQEVEVNADVIFGTDGAGSVVRRGVMAHSASLRFDYSQSWLAHGYKELIIPPGRRNNWRLRKEALHIWPRQEYMLIALPNLDGSFTVTLFLAFEGDPSFAQLDSPDAVSQFFSDVFPTAYAHMPTLTNDFFANPTPPLGTIRCYPWQAFNRLLLLGDAAHAIVPFYGQGMNCSLEDVTILDELIVQHDSDWSAVLPAFEQKRKADADAIADLAIGNYYEMRDHVDNPEFIAKRELEMRLEQQYADYSSKYNLVTFNEDTSYSQARQRGDLQDNFLLNFCRKHPDVESIDIEQLYQQLKLL